MRIFAPLEGGGKAHLADTTLPSAYVEEEFLVSGVGNIYAHDAAGALVVKNAARPYTTRILIRRPRDRSQYSGVLVFDLLYPEAGQSTLWPSLRGYIISSRDAYVQVTTRREGRNPVLAGTPGAIDQLKLKDSVRYGPIEFPDGGLTWDIISQIGRLVRTDFPKNPLRDFRPKTIIAGGFSGAGALTLFYINGGFADKARMPGGKPIFDGYFVGEPSWYPRVNSTASTALDMADDDPRQQVQPRDVPAISLYSMWVTTPMGVGRLRADSDAPDDRYRFYVVAGASHVGRTQLEGEYNSQVAKCENPPNTFPLNHYIALTFDYLKRWSQGKKIPPHAPPLELDDRGKPVPDSNGNPKGGIRSTAVDVPAARHFDGAGGFLCELTGADQPFSPEKLRELYGSRAGYVARVAARTRQLQNEGWLLSESAAEVISEAEAVKFDR